MTLENDFFSQMNAPILQRINELEPIIHPSTAEEVEKLENLPERKIQAFNKEYKRLKAINQAFLNIKGRVPTGEMTVQKFIAIKNLFNKAKKERPIPFTENVIPSNTELSALIFNTANLAALTLQEKVLLAQLFLRNDIIGIMQLCKEKDLLKSSQIDIKAAIRIMGSSNATEMHDTLSYVIRLLSPDPLSAQIQDISTSQFLKLVFTNENDRLEYIDKYFPLTYDESAPQLKSQNISTKITAKEYQSAIKATLDYSDFIILTNGLLQSLSDKPMSQSLASIFNKIERNYFEFAYQDCIADLLSCAESLRKNNKIDITTYQQIIFASKKCTEVNKDENYSKRFYELRLAQYGLGQLDNPDKMASINRLSEVFGMNKITTSSEAEENLRALIHHTEEIHHDILDRRQYFRELTPISKTKDREMRGGFSQKEDESFKKLQGLEEIQRPKELESSGNIEKSAYSRNLGGMKANQPNFPDLIANAPIRNRIVDIFESPERVGGYSS